MYPSRRLRQKTRCLPRRIAATYHGHFLGLAQLRFHVRRAIIHAVSFELPQVWQRQLVILRSRPDDARARGQRLSAIQFDQVRLTVAVEPQHAPRDQQPRAELQRLRHRTPS